MNIVQLGKYELFENLGRGGYGTVYRARYTVLNVERAVKVLHPQLSADPEFIERFRREARHAAQLEHAHVVPVYDLDEAQGSYFLAMKYMAGGSLKNLLDKTIPLPFAAALEITRQVALALDYAHSRGLVHRDVKPGNILFEPGQTANLVVARLGDFGFARAIQGTNSESFSYSGGIQGTPAYMAPEAWESKDPQPSMDVYSLACVFYEMITGRALFGGQSPLEIIRHHALDELILPEQWPQATPPGIEQVFRQALARHADQRYPRASDLPNAVQQLINALQETQAAQERARLAAEEQARKEEEEQNRRAIETLARQAAVAQARHEIEERIQREAEERARQEAEVRARLAEAESARKQAEEQARLAAESQTRLAAIEQARRETDEYARKEAAAREKIEAEEKVLKKAREDAQREAEAKAKREAIAQARRETEEKDRREAEERKKQKARLNRENENKKRPEQKQVHSAMGLLEEVPVNTRTALATDAELNSSVDIGATHSSTAAKQKRRRWLIWLAAGALIVLIAGLAWGISMITLTAATPTPSITLSVTVTRQPTQTLTNTPTGQTLLSNPSSTSSPTVPLTLTNTRTPVSTQSITSTLTPSASATLTKQIIFNSPIPPTATPKPRNTQAPSATLRPSPTKTPVTPVNPTKTPVTPPYP